MVEFDAVSVEVTPSSPVLPDIIPSRYSVCGHVTITRHHTSLKFNVRIVCVCVCVRVYMLNVVVNLNCNFWSIKTSTNNLFYMWIFQTKSRNLVLVSESGDNGGRVSLDSNGDFCYMLSPGEYSISVRGVAYY